MPSMLLIKYIWINWSSIFVQTATQIGNQEKKWDVHLFHIDSSIVCAGTDHTISSIFSRERLSVWILWWLSTEWGSFSSDRTNCIKKQIIICFSLYYHIIVNDVIRIFPRKRDVVIVTKFSCKSDWRDIKVPLYLRIRHVLFISLPRFFRIEISIFRLIHLCNFSLRSFVEGRDCSLNGTQRTVSSLQRWTSPPETTLMRLLGGYYPTQRNSACWHTNRPFVYSTRTEILCTRARLFFSFIFLFFSFFILQRKNTRYNLFFTLSRLFLIVFRLGWPDGNDRCAMSTACS